MRARPSCAVLHAGEQGQQDVQLCVLQSYETSRTLSCTCLTHAMQPCCPHWFAAAATTGRKDTRDSFFMASDKSLLEIMQQQGLRCFVDIMDLHRGARVGLNAFLAKFILHAVVKAGTIKFFQGMIQSDSLVVPACTAQFGICLPFKPCCSLS